MYSVVLMVAATSGGDMASFGGRDKGGCSGYTAGCNGCDGGGGFLGLRNGGGLFKHKDKGGCHGSYAAGCTGSAHSYPTYPSTGCTGHVYAAPVATAPVVTAPVAPVVTQPVAPVYPTGCTGYGHSYAPTYDSGSCYGSGYSNGCSGGGGFLGLRNGGGLFGKHKSKGCSGGCYGN